MSDPRPIGTTLATLATLAVLAPCTSLAALDPAARRCVSRLAEDVAAVAQAQADVDVACLRAATSGAEPDPQGCLAADAKGRVAKATGRTAADVIALCAVFPPFGAPPRLSETVNAAGTVHETGLVTDLFGPDLQAAAAAGAADERVGRCQVGVLRSVERLAAARVRDYRRCADDALPTAADAAALAACIGRDTRGVVHAQARLTSLVAGRCPAPSPGGRCAGATGAALASCLGERVACRTCRLLDSAGALGADCDVLDDGLANGSCRLPVSISGNAIPFNGGNARIAGAEIWVLEHPEMRVTTSVDGAFQFDGLDEGSDATLVLDHPDYHPIQTGTIRLGPLGATRVTFQAVVPAIYDALALLLGLTPDPTLCQMVTTVTRVGKSLYDPGAHGEAGATVSLAGATPGEGPIYFNSSVLPDRSLHETSDDGGVLFVNAPPGEYRWTATKPGAAFSSLHMKCRPNVLVNASPPWGLQRQ